MGNEATFSEKMANKIFGVHDYFLGDEVVLRQNEYNVFYYKLDAKYFYVKQFFWKKQYSLKKLQKTVLGAYLTIL